MKRPNEHMAITYQKLAAILSDGIRRNLIAYLNEPEKYCAAKRDLCERQVRCASAYREAMQEVSELCL